MTALEEAGVRNNIDSFAEFILKKMTDWDLEKS
jgi:hypothetical protein